MIKTASVTLDKFFVGFVELPFSTEETLEISSSHLDVLDYYKVATNVGLRAIEEHKWERGADVTFVYHPSSHGHHILIEAEYVPTYRKIKKIVFLFLED